MEKAGKCLISVITVFDHRSENIQETYYSLQTQTISNFEWIIVHEGSADTWLENFARHLLSQGKEIRIIHNPANKGLSAAKNIGIGDAKGEFLFFIDSGDKVAPTALEKFLLTFEFNLHFDFVNSYGKALDEKGSDWPKGFQDRELFLQENRNTSCFMARKAVFQKIHFNESLKNGTEEWDFWLNAASMELWGYTIPEFLLHYRRTDRLKPKNAANLSAQLEKSELLLKKKYMSLRKKGFPERGFSSYYFGPIPGELPESQAYPQAVGNTNILFIFPWLEVGGADKFNLDLAKGLKEKGWSITILCTLPSENKWLPEFEKITSNIFFASHYASETDYYKIIKAVILSRNIGILFLSNSVYGYHLLPYIRQKFPQLPVVDYVHCEEEEWYNGGYPMFSATYNRLIARNFVSSGHLKDWCSRRGSKDEKIEVIYTNVDSVQVKRDSALRNSLRKKLQVDNDTALILFVGRLTTQKQPDVLFKSLSKLYEINKNFLCVIIGDGPERKQLTTDINRSPASKNIIYLGETTNNEVKSYMDAADIFFLPSAYEGIALAIFEAMSKELAIVGAKVGGQEELVTEDCGILVQRSEPEKESDSYSRILNEFIVNLDVTRRMGKKGRERVEGQFDLSHMIDKMDSSLRETVREYKRPAGPEIENEYIVVLNRLLMLTAKNGELVEKLNQTLPNLLSRYDRQIKLAKKIHHKFKRISNR